MLIHGMCGNPTHRVEMARICQEVHGTDKEDSERVSNGEGLHIIVPAETYDGIEWGGEKATEEIYFTLGLWFSKFTYRALVHRF